MKATNEGEGGGGETHTELMQTSEALTMTFRDDALETAKLFYTGWMELVYIFGNFKIMNVQEI